MATVAIRPRPVRRANMQDLLVAGCRSGFRSRLPFVGLDLREHKHIIGASQAIPVRRRSERWKRVSTTLAVDVGQTGSRLLLAHGDARLTPPLSTQQIARDFLRTWRELERCGAHVFAFGHSHHARLWRKRAFDAPAELLASHTVPLDPQSRYFLNVGTTGLPFPGKGPPSVAVVDFCAARIQHLALGRQ
jgi:hypothetical protein